MYGRSILVVHNADSYSHAEGQSSTNIEWISQVLQIQPTTASKYKLGDLVYNDDLSEIDPIASMASNNVRLKLKFLLAIKTPGTICDSPLYLYA